MTNAVSLAQYGSTGVSQGFKNRIINGAMVIDQRNAGASVTPTGGQYTLDRYFYNANASRITISQSSIAPAGFTKSLLVTSTAASTIGTSDYTNLCQIIEGFNIADFSWGTADAKTITLSFWVRSSVTGTFGGAVRNDASGSGYYGYPFTYVISAANTWTQVSVTIPGPTNTSYGWNTTNGSGIYVWWDFGTGTTYTNVAGAWANQNIVGANGTTKLVNTNGATWYLTGVQLEVGSAATSFEYRPYTTELQLCQRYFRLMPPLQGNFLSTGAALWIAGASNAFTNMRATPTGTLVSGASMIHVASVANYNITSINSITDSYVVVVTNSSPGAYIPSHAYQTTTSNGIFLSSEL